MLNITNLSISLQDSKEKSILENISFLAKPGSIHAFMGPNGSGKSTLVKTIAGYPEYVTTSGNIQFQENSLDETLDIEERARLRIFLAHQNPVSVPGIQNSEFLHMLHNNKQKYLNLEETDAFDFENILNEKMNWLKMDPAYKTRCLNDGFSGGEKKKNEVLQMCILDPLLCMLDEIDSGLDIDALKVVAKTLTKIQTKKNIFLLVTHFPRIFQYIKPNFVHILHAGRMIETGDVSLAQTLEQKGYEHFLPKNSKNKQHINQVQS